MSQEQKITKTNKIKYTRDMPTVYYAPINNITNEAMYLKINHEINRPQIEIPQMNMWGYTDVYPYREIDMKQMDVWGFTFDSNLKK
jgi:hypothetical protein